LDLKDDVERQANTQELDNIVANRIVPNFKNLENDLLPDNLKSSDLFDVLDGKYRNLKEQEFKNDFRKEKGAGLATDEEIESYFELKFDGNTPPY